MPVPIHTLFDYDYREVKVSREIVASSRRAILVSDSSKYGRSAPVRIGHISEINHFVTDAAPPPRLRRICEENGAALDVATEGRNEGQASA